MKTEKETQMYRTDLRTQYRGRKRGWAVWRE